MQSGGGLPPFATYTPVTVNNATPAPSTTDTTATKKSDGLADKDLLGLLKDLNGLPSDMQYLTESLSRFYNINAGELDAATLSSKYIQVLNQIKTANFNKAEFDKAYKEVAENKGLSEYAITNTGHVVVITEDNPTPQTISVDQYLNNTDKYRALTNSELLSLRANSQDFAMQNGILRTVENGIGLEKIQSLIKSSMMSIGTDSYSSEGYHKKEQQTITEGIEYLQMAQKQGANLSGLTIEGLYHDKILTKDQADKAAYAVTYMYNMLPENAKAVLKLKTGSTENSKKLIASMISAGLSSTIDFSTQMVKDPNADGSDSGSGEDKTDKTSFIQNVQSGKGGDTGLFILNKGTQAEMSVDGTNYRSIITNDGKTIQDTNLANMLAESGLQSIVDKKSISFGNQIVNQDKVRDIVYRNSGGTRVLLPCVHTVEGVKPDSEILDKYQKVIDKVNAKCTPDTPLEKRRQLEGQYLRESGLGEYVGADGTPNMDKFQLFLVTDGYMSSKSLELSDDNDMVETIDGKDEATYKYITDVLNQGRSKEDKMEELDSDSYWPGDWFGLYDEVYKASVYIPIVSYNRLAALTASGGSVTQNTGQKIEADYQRFQKLRTMNNSSTDVL